MAETVTFCDHVWHEQLVRLTQRSLDATAFSSTAMDLREQIAKLLAKHGRYDVEGEEHEQSAVEQLAEALADVVEQNAAAVPAETDIVPPQVVVDWRTEEQRAEDATRTGTCWRCPDHGAHVNAIVLCAHAYCAVDGCTKAVLSVGSEHEEFARHAR